MQSSAKLGILLTDIASGELIGAIEFTSSGMLITQSAKKELHVFALKSIIRRLEESVLKQPLYIKYENLLKERSELPMDILEQEARICADELNRLTPALTVGGYSCKALVARKPD
jgi:hypothetical protein